MASPICEVKDGAGAYQATDYGVDVTPGNTITIKLSDSSDVDVWELLCLTTDETSDAAAINAALVVDPATKTATFPMPAGTGRALRFWSRVNQGKDHNFVAKASYATTFGIYALAGGRRVMAADETLEQDPDFGWIASYNDMVRNPPGGGTVPTGTGFRHVTAGAEDAATKLVENADVAPGAAIALSKLVNPTGTGLVKASGGAFSAAASLLVNADVDAAAAIALSKLVNPTGTGLVKASSGAFSPAASLLVNADVDAAAAIAGTKVAPNFGTQSMGARGLYATGVLTLTDAGPTTFNNYAIGSYSMLYVVNSTGLLTFTGFAAPAAGVYQDLIIIGQQAGFGFTLLHDDAGSTAANRIYINGGLSGGTFYSAHLRYVHDQSRWCLAAYPL